MARGEGVAEADEVVDVEDRRRGGTVAVGVAGAPPAGPMAVGLAARQVEPPADDQAAAVHVEGHSAVAGAVLKTLERRPGGAVPAGDVAGLDAAEAGDAAGVREAAGDVQVAVVGAEVEDGQRVAL